MALCLLDSDAVIDHLKSRSEMNRLIARLIHSGDTLCTCAVVLSEVHSGLHPADTDRAMRFLASLSFLTSTPEIGQQAGTWRYTFARQGRAVATPDALVAATAHFYGASLVTRNVKHYPMDELTLASPTT